MLTPLLTIGLILLFIMLAFWALEPCNFDRWMPQSPRQARVLKVLVACALGFLVASMFSAFLQAAVNLPAALRGN